MIDESTPHSVRISGFVVGCSARHNLELFELEVLSFVCSVVRHSLVDGGGGHCSCRVLDFFAVSLVLFFRSVMLVLLALLFSFCAFAAAELDDFDKAEQLLQTNPLAAEAMFSAMVLKNKDNVIALFGLGQARYSLKKYYDCQSTMER
jgi:hypothetical protein